MSALGSCDKCQGDLCTRGALVVCQDCNTPHADHPLSKQMAVEQKAAEAKLRTTIPFEAKPADFAMNDHDRIAALEKRLARLEKIVAGASPKKAM